MYGVVYKNLVHHVIVRLLHVQSIALFYLVSDSTVPVYAPEYNILLYPKLGCLPSI